MSALTHINNRPCRVLIDRSAITHNLEVVRQTTSSSMIMAVIKADAYGHGMEVAALALAQADEFAVTSLDDVKRLREYGIDKPITLLSALLNTSEIKSLVSLNVRPTIFDHTQLSLISKLKLSEPLSIWLKVDTGMGRLGILPCDLLPALDLLKANSSIRDISLMTHLANADDPLHPQNQQQIKIFNDVIKQHDFYQTSILNSAGIMGNKDAALDVVRPGVMLYGISPLQGKTSKELMLKPAMTFKSELISIKHLPKGSKVGYGGSYQLKRESKIGIIGCGYGDGYPRHAPSGSIVLVNGERVSLVGRVSMDMIAVDLNDIKASIGDEAILWGKDNPIEGLATAAGTIAYELSCGISSRVERITV